MSVSRGELTPEQWQEVLRALPEAHKLARSLARRCRSHTADELATLAEDSLMRRVRYYDTARNTPFFAFAREGVRLDLIRAAHARANNRNVAAGLHAIDLAEEAIEAPDLGAKFAEAPEERVARALAMGAELRDAAVYADAAASPEHEVGENESFQWMKRVAADSDQVTTLLELLYEQDCVWKEAAGRLQISVRQAQRLHAAAIIRLREAINARDQP